MIQYEHSQSEATFVDVQFPLGAQKSSAVPTAKHPPVVYEAAEPPTLNGLRCPGRENKEFRHPNRKSWTSENQSGINLLFFVLDLLVLLGSEGPVDI